MKGLLIKDLYMAVKYCKSIFVLAAAFTVAAAVNPGNAFYTLYPAVIAGIIPVSLVAYDERSKWDVFSGAFPYRRRELVSAKYIMGLAAVICVAVIELAGTAIAYSLKVDPELGNVLLNTVATFSAGLISPAIIMPFVFKFGSERGRIAYYIMLGAMCALIVGLSSVRRAMDISINGNAVVWMFIAACVIFAASWMLSIKFYEKREL